ncbi:Exocyst complex component 4 [Liparis tanakae]|uniref:Exocyst complex component Sec8 n=1 Tax=Liparis tanakae TaxID=230148 RepID=A0A4Z2EHP0_9TELE|nr:Exocyst complex component 4 [Liparis tanakae]
MQLDARDLNQADLPEVDPEENSAEFMGILIKALAKLKKIPEAIKAIMERLEPELKQIVKRSTTQIADHAYQRGENLAQESQPRYSHYGEDEETHTGGGGTVVKCQGFLSEDSYSLKDGKSKG